MEAAALERTWVGVKKTRLRLGTLDGYGPLLRWMVGETVISENSLAPCSPFKQTQTRQQRNKYTDE